MAFTREQSYRTLAALEPAPVFLQAYQVKRLPEDLDIYFGPPEEFFIAPDTQEAYTRGRLVPILDDGNFGVVTFYDPDTQTLVQMDVESPDEVRVTFAHWQQYLADLMVQVGESVDSDEQVRRIAQIVRFSHVAELFEFFQHVAKAREGEYDAMRQRFVVDLSA